MGSGTPRKITLDGLTYRWASDADLAEEVGQETEGIPTSGETMYKTTKKTANVAGEAIVEDDEFETLKETLAKQENYPISYENVNGTVNRCTGRANLENRTTAENRVPLTLIPATGWTTSLS